LPRKALASFLHAHLAIRRHDDANRLAVDLRHQCLQHAVRLRAERFRRLQADAFRIGIVGIGVKREANIRTLEGAGCGRGSGH
jgi:hypothetical protein